ncbi:MAG TPA: hypothetical protein PLW19_08465, partial [Anaerolineaceae bacterium]|nr:hypothetical protein [Anaerolineaceae bacterium]
FTKDPDGFRMRPDIVVSNKNKTVIVDTKWKVLSKYKDFRPSSEDMYQMYAYGKKYEAQTVVLLYPEPADLEFDKAASSSIKTEYTVFDDIKIKTMFVSYSNEDDSIDESVNKSLRAVLDEANS